MNLLEIVKEFSHEDNYWIKINEEEIEKLQNVKQKRIKCELPICFVRNSKDIEKRLFISMPDVSTEVATVVVEEGGPNNSNIKNLRISEKRDFELENCKLNANIREQIREENEAQVLLAGKTKGFSSNLFAVNPVIVEDISVRELTNSQMFN